MISYQTGSGKMAFAAARQVLLVLVITAEYQSVFLFFSAKRLFFLRELNHMEDEETLSQRKSFPFSCGDTLLLCLPPCK